MNLHRIGRCNRPAVAYSAVNGFRVCDLCLKTIPDGPVFYDCAEAGPPPYGRCDNPIDGLGAASWSNRLSAAKAELRRQDAMRVRR
jgi:hypothetical protein